MGTAVAATGHAESHDGIDHDHKVRLGMLFYVLTDATFVVFLLVSYIWLRAYNTDGGWFPFKGMQLPDPTTSFILVVLMVLSGVCYFAAYRGVRSGNQSVLKFGLLVALILLIVTLVWQIRFLGQQQFGTNDGTFADMFILLGGYHVYHMILGLFMGIGVTNRAFQGRYTADRHLGIVTIGYFWYWMALMPVVVAIMMAVLPPRI